MNETGWKDPAGSFIGTACKAAFKKYVKTYCSTDYSGKQACAAHHQPRIRRLLCFRYFMRCAGGPRPGPSVPDYLAAPVCAAHHPGSVHPQPVSGSRRRLARFLGHESCHGSGVLCALQIQG